MKTQETKATTPLRQTGIKVKLVGEDGNAFAILGRVRAALRRGGESPEFIAAFTKEATSGDYNHLLATVLSVVEEAGDSAED